MKIINNHSCFSENLSVISDKLNRKKPTNLVSKWSTVHKTKQKLYIKLYQKLLKSHVLKSKNTKSNKYKLANEKIKNTKCLDLLNYPDLYNFAKYDSFLGKHLKGYTRHGEKIYNIQSRSKIKNLYTKYNKLKNTLN